MYIFEIKNDQNYCYIENMYFTKEFKAYYKNFLDIPSRKFLYNDNNNNDEIIITIHEKM